MDDLEPKPNLHNLHRPCKGDLLVWLLTHAEREERCNGFAFLKHAAPYLLGGASRYTTKSGSGTFYRWLEELLNEEYVVACDEDSVPEKLVTYALTHSGVAQASVRVHYFKRLTGDKLVGA